MDDHLLTIGAFARRSRLSPKALRLYERLGVLVPADVDPTNGYRRYHEDQLSTARLVAMLRRLDMPLSEVAVVVTAEPETAAQRLHTFWTAVENRHAWQRELAAHLRARLAQEEGNPAMFGEVQQRDVPEQLILSEQRHVTADKLPDWIHEAGERLHGQATDAGGITAPAFVIYHGEVTEDSDGPVEVCVPVPKSSPNAASRVEPAHHEAYVRLRKAQVAYPQILSAYDTVAAWISQQNLTIDGSPREVYFADFATAAPGDEVCDVAFPIA